MLSSAELKLRAIERIKRPQLGLAFLGVILCIVGTIKSIGNRDIPQDNQYRVYSDMIAALLILCHHLVTGPAAAPFSIVAIFALGISLLFADIHLFRLFLLKYYNPDAKKATQLLYAGFWMMALSFLSLPGVKTMQRSKQPGWAKIFFASLAGLQFCSALIAFAGYWAKVNGNDIAPVVEVVYITPHLRLAASALFLFGSWGNNEVALVVTVLINTLTSYIASRFYDSWSKSITLDVNRAAVIIGDMLSWVTTIVIILMFLPGFRAFRGLQVPLGTHIARVELQRFKEVRTIISVVALLLFIVGAVLAGTELDSRVGSLTAPLIMGALAAFANVIQHGIVLVPNVFYELKNAEMQDVTRVSRPDHSHRIAPSTSTRDNGSSRDKSDSEYDYYTSSEDDGAGSSRPDLAEDRRRGNGSRRRDRGLDQARREVAAAGEVRASAFTGLTIFSITATIFQINSYIQYAYSDNINTSPTTSLFKIGLALCAAALFISHAAAIRLESVRTGISRWSKEGGMFKLGMSLTMLGHVLLAASIALVWVAQTDDGPSGIQYIIEGTAMMGGIWAGVLAHAGVMSECRRASWMAMFALAYSGSLALSYFPNSGRRDDAPATLRPAVVLYYVAGFVYLAASWTQYHGFVKTSIHRREHRVDEP